MKRLLFVDDDPMVLQGLQRSLRSMRDEWTMEFANGGPEALAALERNPFDAIISDMRMPGMDGAQLLQEVKSRYPQMVRIVLSGQSSRESLLRSIAPTHQYLSKPCELQELKVRLAQAFALRDMLQNPAVVGLVSSMKSVPSCPALYDQVMDELGSEDPSMAKIAQIISKDAGMTAKILQLANSAFLGVRSRVSNPMQAVCLIGMEMIRALVLSLHVFSQFQRRELSEISWEDLWAHSINTASLAQAIAVAQKAPKEISTDAFTGGLLHDIGKLIFISEMPDKYQKVMQVRKEKACNLLQAEHEVIGCHHAEVGAYLIGIWGLPHPIVEAVGWHHHPDKSASRLFSPLTAVHAADVIAAIPGPNSNDAVLNTAYLQEVGIADREASWREIYETTIANRKPPGGIA